MKIEVLWDVTLCQLLKHLSMFQSVPPPNHQGLITSQHTVTSTGWMM